MKKARYDFDTLETGTEVLRAMAHPLRLSIIDLLDSNPELSVTEIHEALEVEQSIASHQLRILKDKGIVKARREGKNTFYALRDSKAYQILDLLSQLITD